MRVCICLLLPPVQVQQAEDRAHRIGQSRDVLVLRLLAENTIEEHILDVAEQKRKFADSSITGGTATVPPMHGVIDGSFERSKVGTVRRSSHGWRLACARGIG